MTGVLPVLDWMLDCAVHRAGLDLDRAGAERVLHFRAFAALRTYAKRPMPGKFLFELRVHCVAVRALGLPKIANLSSLSNWKHCVSQLRHSDGMTYDTD